MIEIPDEIRLKLAKKYLDWAEALPQFQGGTIAWLQKIRKHQRKLSEDFCNKYKISEKITIKYVSFSLVELFFVEDVKKLKSNLLRLFPNLDSVIEEESFSETIDYLVKSMSSGSFLPLGRIVKERKNNHYYIGRDLVEIKSLPKEVSYIDVYFYKVYPSSFLISFDVFLNDKASQKILELQKIPHLSNIRFEALFPIKKSAYSKNSPYQVTINEILLWKEQLRGKVENSLESYINGYFMQSSPNKIAKLPSFEVILLKGAEDKNDNLLEWLQNNRSWLDYLGCNIAQGCSYTNGKDVFSFYSNFNSMSIRNISNQLLVLLDNYDKIDEQSEIFDSIENEAIRESNSLLIALIPYCTYLQLIDSFQEQINELRKKVFTSINSNLLSSFKLNSQIKLNNSILQSAVSVDRVYSEINDDALLFLNGNNSIEKFESIVPMLENLSSDKSNLKRDLVKITKKRAEFLKSHIKLVNEWYSQYLSLRNMSTMYWFTFAILMLTIVSVVGTNNIRSFIFNFVHNLNFDIVPSQIE